MTPNIQLNVPIAVKRALVEEFMEIHKNNKRVPLPRDPNVEGVLQQARTPPMNAPLFSLIPP